MAEPTCIRVWEFYYAPPELRALSGHGGDEDYVIVVPLDGVALGRERARQLAVCDYSEHATEYEQQQVMVFITCHA